MELNKSNQSIGGGDSSSDLAKSQWDETKVNDKVDVASSAIDQDKDTEAEKSADKAKAFRMKKLVASVAIGLTLAVSGGVHAYHQHVENQRVAEAVKEEQERGLEQANQRRQEYLDQVPDFDDLFRDEYIYNEADRAFGRDIDSNSARVLSPAEFEEYFHITPEDYQKQCLEKYGINADDFADDTEAEAQQRFDEAKQEKDEYEAESKARREAAEQRGIGWHYERQKPPFTDAELQALQSGDVSYFRKSKESKVKQALNAKISELRGARDEAIRQQLDQSEANAHTHPKEDTSGRNDVDEIEDRHDCAYHEREQEQWGGGREEIPDTIDLQ
ncbi:hypothetical protein HG443_001630 [Candidatus Saccharibacteria bacterium]|nr:hypothetical protein [Candidatus Saccharibacteria bacterium]